MSVSYNSELQNNALQIKNETVAHANSATRLGQMFQDIIDSKSIWTKVSLSSAAIGALDATPITLVSAPSSGFILVPNKIIGIYTFLTSAYNAVSLDVRFNGQTDVLLTLNGLISQVANANLSDSLMTDGLNFLQENVALEVVASGNTGAGAGSVDLYLQYDVLKL